MNVADIVRWMRSVVTEEGARQESFWKITRVEKAENTENVENMKNVGTAERAENTGIVESVEDAESMAVMGNTENAGTVENAENAGTGFMGWIPAQRDWKDCMPDLCSADIICITAGERTPASERSC